MPMSNGERKIAALLDQGDIIYEQEFSFPDLKSDKGVPLRFDFAVFEDIDAYEQRRVKFLIEFQGEQHYRQKFTSREAFNRQVSNDKRKRNYCKVKGIQLIAIPYTEYNSMTLDSILEQGHFFD